MIGSFFVDESGTGDEPKMVVGGLGASVLRWHGFGSEWRQLMLEAGVPYAHTYEMEKGKGPFARGWKGNRGRQIAFINDQLTILNKWCQVGLTVSLDKALYRDVYRNDFPTRHAPDSPYGVCSKELILQTQRIISEKFTEVETINFVWERGHANLPNVMKIFHDLKDCYGERAKDLGAFVPLTRDEAPALQAIDRVVTGGRRLEPIAIRDKLFIKFEAEATIYDMQASLPPGDNFPVFYFDINEDRLRWHRDNKVEMDNGLKRKRRGASR